MSPLCNATAAGDVDEVDCCAGWVEVVAELAELAEVEADDGAGAVAVLVGGWCG